MAFPKNQLHNRGMRAAAALLLCIAITAALLFSRLTGYAVTDPRQYIPLTRSNGITLVSACQGNTGLSRKSSGLASHRPVLLAASPFLTGSWFRVTDENTVWNGNTQVEIFRVSYENDGGEITVRSGNGDKVIAPGTENSYTFALENTADGPLEYELSMKAYLSDGSRTIPVQARVRRDPDGQYLLGSETSYADVMQLNRVSDSGTLHRGYVMPYTLSWQWPFAGDDALDTALGISGEDLTLTIVLETTASYAPPDTDGGIPKTGDTSGICLWFTVMLLSGAGLLILLLLMERRGEAYERG